MKLVLSVAAGLLALTATAQAAGPPNTTDLFVVTGEGHQVTATWRATEPSHFKCWLTRPDGTETARNACAPPKYYDGLGLGTWKLHVRAISNETGLIDPTPAVATFNINAQKVATKTTAVPTNQPAGLPPGYTTAAYLEVGDDPARSNRWHAKLFAGIRKGYGSDGKWCAWAYETGIVTAWGGRFRERDVRRDKGTPCAGWHDGWHLGQKWQAFFSNHSGLETFYDTDFGMGYANWDVQMDLKQWITRRVGRSVKWSGGANAPKEGGA